MGRRTSARCPRWRKTRGWSLPEVWPGLAGRDLTINQNTWVSPSAFFFRAKNYTLAVPYVPGTCESSPSFRYTIISTPHSRSQNHIRHCQIFPPSPVLHPQNNCTYRDPFPQANPDSSPAHPHSAILQLCPSTENLGKRIWTSKALPPHNRWLFFTSTTK